MAKRNTQAAHTQSSPAQLAKLPLFVIAIIENLEFGSGESIFIPLSKNKPGHPPGRSSNRLVQLLIESKENPGGIRGQIFDVGCRRGVEHIRAGVFGTRDFKAQFR